MDETKLIKATALALKKAGFLESVKSKDKVLTVRLAFHKKEPKLIDLKLVSKPGLRIYMKVDELQKKKGSSIYILSTPKGILSTKEALKEGVGGEVIVELW